MKKLILAISLAIIMTNIVQASEFSETIYDIRNGISVISDIKRLQNELSPSKTPQTQQNTSQVPTQVQNANYTYTTNDEISFNAKSLFIEGNSFLRDGNYAMAQTCYNDAKNLFESIGDIENVKKVDLAIQKAAEMYQEFGKI